MTVDQMSPADAITQNVGTFGEITSLNMSDALNEPLRQA